MDNNVMNGTLMLIAVLFGLRNVITLIWGKRIAGDFSGMSAGLQLCLLGLGFYFITDETRSLSLEVLIVALIICFIVWWLHRYIRGVKYTIYSHNKNDLIRDIEIGLREIEGTKFEKVIENDQKTIFVLPDTNKKIELIQQESMFKKKVTYEIIFKKWRSYESRREMLFIIENTLLEDETGRVGKLSIVGQLLMLSAGAAIALFLLSNAILEPESLENPIPTEPPALVYLVEKDEYIEINEEVLNLHDFMKSAMNYKIFRKENKTTIMGYTKVLLYYQPENIDNVSGKEKDHDSENQNENRGKKDIQGREVFVGQNSGHVYVHYSEIGSKSPFHKILWQFQKLYNKDEGMYYNLFSEDFKQWEELVEKVVSTREEGTGN